MKIAYEAKNADLGLEKIEIQKRFDDLKWKFEKFETQKRELDSLNEERHNEHKWTVEKFNLEKREYETHKESRLKEISEQSKKNSDLLAEIDKKRRENLDHDSEVRAERELIESLNKKNKQQLDD